MKRKLFLLSIAILTFGIINAQDFTEIVKAIPPDGTSQDAYGTSVAIDGDYAIVGAYAEDHDANGGNYVGGAGSAYILKKDQGGTDSWSLVKKIVASDRSGAALFGWSVDISGDYAIVGAYATTETGSGGGTFTAAGTAYIFRKDEGGTDNWGEVKKLVASDVSTNDRFGHSVSISGDYAVVAAHVKQVTVGIVTYNTAGSVYVFKKDEGGADNWGELQKLIPSDINNGDVFGQSVAISGEYIVVGASSGNASYIFKKDHGGVDNWGELKRIVSNDLASGDSFGESVDIDGDYVIIASRFDQEDAAGNNSLHNAGSVYIFNKDEGGTDNWGQVQKIVASDRDQGDAFGSDVAISGDYAVVGARFEDEDADGNNTLYLTGSAYIFHKDEGGVDNWGEIQKIAASDRESHDHFGESVGISGDYVIVGIPGKYFYIPSGGFYSDVGAAYIFKPEEDCTGITHGQLRKIVNGDREAYDAFGYDVAIDGDYAVVSAVGQSTDANGMNTMLAAGAAYILKRDHGGADNWGILKKIVASDRAAEDQLGISVAIAGDYIFVAAPNETEDENGNNFLHDAGSVYVFKKDEGGTDNWGEIKKIVPNDRERRDLFSQNGIDAFGDYLVVGAFIKKGNVLTNDPLYWSGVAYIFKKDQGGTDNWGQVKKLITSDRTAHDYVGRGVAISGDYCVIGAYGQDTDAAGTNSVSHAGAAYVFKKDEGGVDNWGEIKKIVPSDRGADDWFGWPIAISGDYIVAGARHNDYDAANMNTLSNAGAAYIFKKDEGGTDNWGEVKKIVASDRAADDWFGSTVDIDGDYVIVGSVLHPLDENGANSVASAGAVYMYHKDEGGTDNWGQTKKFVASDRGTTDAVFGWSAGISGETLLVGAWGEAEDVSGANSLTRAGAVYTFKCGAATVLPVELAHFEGQLIESEVLLNWNTLSEINNEGFHIQRSATGKTWENIGFVQGVGTILESQEYDFTDHEPYQGINYYRLKQVDIDGQFEYSQIVTIDNSRLNKQSVVLYPNPAKNTLNIRGLEGQTLDKIEIINVNGQVLQALHHTTQINILQLPSGVYFLKITLDDGNVDVQRFIKR